MCVSKHAPNTAVMLYIFMFCADEQTTITRLHDVAGGSGHALSWVWPVSSWRYLYMA